MSTKNNEASKGEMTCREAQQLATQRIRELYGEEHWHKMGLKGGRALVESRGRSYMRKIGRNGGRAPRKADREKG